MTPGPPPPFCSGCFRLPHPYLFAFGLPGVWGAATAMGIALCWTVVVGAWVDGRSYGLLSGRGRALLCCSGHNAKGRRASGAGARAGTRVPRGEDGRPLRERVPGHKERVRVQEAERMASRQNWGFWSLVAWTFGAAVPTVVATWRWATASGAGGDYARLRPGCFCTADWVAVGAAAGGAASPIHCFKPSDPIGLCMCVVLFCLSCRYPRQLPYDRAGLLYCRMLVPLAALSIASMNCSNPDTFHEDSVFRIAGGSFFIALAVFFCRGGVADLLLVQVGTFTFAQVPLVVRGGSRHRLNMMFPAMLCSLFACMVVTGLMLHLAIRFRDERFETHLALSRLKRWGGSTLAVMTSSFWLRPLLFLAGAVVVTSVNSYVTAIATFAGLCADAMAFAGRDVAALVATFALSIIMCRGGRASTDRVFVGLPGSPDSRDFDDDDGGGLERGRGNTGFRLGSSSTGGSGDGLISGTRTRIAGAASGDGRGGGDGELAVGGTASWRAGGTRTAGVHTAKRVQLSLWSFTLTRLIVAAFVLYSGAMTRLPALLLGIFVAVGIACQERARARPQPGEARRRAVWLYRLLPVANLLISFVLNYAVSNYATLLSSGHHPDHGGDGDPKLQAHPTNFGRGDGFGDGRGDSVPALGAVSPMHPVIGHPQGPHASDLHCMLFFVDALWVFALLDMWFTEVLLQALLSLVRFVAVGGVTVSQLDVLLYVVCSHAIVLFTYAVIVRRRLKDQGQIEAARQVGYSAAVSVTMWAADVPTVALSNDQYGHQF